MRTIKKKESVLEVHTHFKPTETFQYRLYQRRASRLLRTKSSKTAFEENITLFKQRLRNRGYLDNLIIKLFQKSTSAKECRHYKTNPQKHFEVCYEISHISNI